MNNTLGELVQRSGIDVADVHHLTYARMRFAEALAIEDHQAIAFYESAIRFWSGLIACKLAGAAIEARDISMARTLNAWARERNVPPARQQEFLNAVLGL